MCSYIISNVTILFRSFSYQKKKKKSNVTIWHEMMLACLRLLELPGIKISFYFLDIIFNTSF